MTIEPYGAVTVLGAGSFGTAMAQHLAALPKGRCSSVQLYGRDNEVIDSINEKRENPKYLAGAGLSDSLTATDSLEEAVTDVELLFLAVPAQHLKDMLPGLADHIAPGAQVVNLAKGVDQEDLKRLSTIIDRDLNKGPRNRDRGARHPLAMLSGPSFARDLVAGHPMGLTLGSKNRKLLKRVQTLLTTPELDVKTTTDMAGVELGGALKNVYALAAGMLSETAQGDSWQGDIFTRAMVELREIGLYMGGRWGTFSGRSGLGDLAITSTPASRNFRFGATYARVFKGLQADGTLKRPDPRHSHEEKEAEKAGPPVYSGPSGPHDSYLPRADSTLHERTFVQTILELGTRTVEGYDTLRPVHDIAASRRLFTPILYSLHQLFYQHIISPDELLPTIRKLDLPRRKEGPRLYSMLLHQLVPRLYYRRF